MVNEKLKFETVKIFYECGSCEEEYDSHTKAQSCCSEWVCGSCNEVCDDKADAVNCCKEAVEEDEEEETFEFGW